MRITTVLGLSILLFHTACNRVSPESSSSINQVSNAKETESPTDIDTKGVKIIDVRTRLIRMSPANVKRMPIDGDDSLLRLQFLDESDGWITATRALYKTTDGGASWSQVQVPLPAKAILSDVFFLNRSLGWVLAHECDSDEPCPEDHFWIAHTADGGVSWQLQYEGQESVAYQIRFYDQQNGWAIGTRYKYSSSPFTPLILHTSDQGTHWNDVSEGILSILAQEKDKMRSPTHDEAAEMILPDTNSLTLLTGRLRFFRTDDRGQSWAQIGYFGDEPDQTGVRQLSKQNDRFFVVGGAASVEGTWGMLVRQQSDGSWQRSRLHGVSFTSVLFLEGDRLLASGSIPTETESPTKRYLLDGVILCSKDGGKSWGVVYRNPQVTSINSLTATPSGKVWAVSDGGLLLRVDYP